MKKFLKRLAYELIYIIVMAIIIVIEMVAFGVPSTTMMILIGYLAIHYGVKLWKMVD